jgi:hypothetical protein
VSFSISGSGTHAIAAGTGFLSIDITTFWPNSKTGRANPTNYFDIGLLRFGNSNGYGPAFAIDGDLQIVPVPSWATTLGYAMIGTSVATVTEVAGQAVTSASSALLPPILSPSSAASIGVQMAANAVTVGTSNSWLTANLSVMVPLDIAETFAIANAFVVNGTAVSGHWDIGIYDASLSLLGHTGSQSQTGTSSLQSVAFSLSLTAGHYYLAMAFDNTTSTTASNNMGGALRMRMAGVRAATSNFPLASSPTTTTPTFGVLPVFGVGKFSP